MKLAICRILFATATTMAALFAQEAAPPTVEVPTTKPAQRTASPGANAEPTIPPDLPEVSQLDELFKRNPLGQKADEFRLHAEWRRLRNQVANSPDVVAAKKAAAGAHTDLQKRQLLRRYYEICYAQMAVLAQEAELKAALEQMKKQHLGTLDQPRVRPSLSPTPTPTTETAEASPTPSPTATPTPEEQSESSGSR
jgi:hypothetical protein